MYDADGESLIFSLAHCSLQEQCKAYSKTAGEWGHRASSDDLDLSSSLVACLFVCLFVCLCVCLFVYSKWMPR